jgi:hypothetical protein
MSNARPPQCGTSRHIDTPLPPPILLLVVLILILVGRLVGYPPSEIAALLTGAATAWYLVAVVDLAQSRDVPLA